MKRKLFDKKIFKVALINLLFIASILLIFELSLGHWFKKDHFGYNMRGKRLQKIDFSINNNKFKKNGHIVETIMVLEKIMPLMTNMI